MKKQQNALDAFEAIADRLTKEGGIDPRQTEGPKRFGTSGLRIAGKVFAMPSQGTLVVKLPKDRVDALVKAGAGKRFDPGYGRLMKEWIALKKTGDGWLKYAREAREYARTRQV